LLAVLPAVLGHSQTPIDAPTIGAHHKSFHDCPAGLPGVPERDRKSRHEKNDERRAKRLEYRRRKLREPIDPAERFGALPSRLRVRRSVPFAAIVVAHPARPREQPRPHPV
jgi:hypothetical protein